MIVIQLQPTGDKPTFKQKNCCTRNMSKVPHAWKRQQHVLMHHAELARFPTCINNFGSLVLFLSRFLL